MVWVLHGVDHMELYWDLIQIAATSLMTEVQNVLNVYVQYEWKEL